MSKRLDALDQMIDKGNEDPFVWYARAMEFRSLGQPTDALKSYEEIAARFPNYVPTYLMAGQVAMELDHVEDAKRWFEKGMSVAHKAGDNHAHAELSTALQSLS